MTITEYYKGIQKNGSYEQYRVLRNFATANRGKKPSKLMNTMRILNVGDAFVYPYPSISCVYRSAKQLGITVETQSLDAGYLVIRVG